MIATAPDILLGIEEDQRKAPKSRLPDGCAGRTLVKKVIQDDQQRSNARALVQGMVAGNQPYNPGQLRKEGRSWEANINWMGGQALMDGSGIPYYSIFTGPSFAAGTRPGCSPCDSTTGDRR